MIKATAVAASVFEGTVPQKRDLMLLRDYLFGEVGIEIIGSGKLEEIIEQNRDIVLQIFNEIKDLLSGSDEDIELTETICFWATSLCGIIGCRYPDLREEAFETIQKISSLKWTKANKRVGQTQPPFLSPYVAVSSLRSMADIALVDQNYIIPSFDKAVEIRELIANDPDFKKENNRYNVNSDLNLFSSIGTKYKDWAPRACDEIEKVTNTGAPMSRLMEVAESLKHIACAHPEFKARALRACSSMRTKFPDVKFQDKIDCYEQEIRSHKPAPRQTEAKPEPVV